uniref:Uncharacterized protein n=1 Tax=Chromera velia CCMP2878 TaxID=1169474 RepID=A0A0G4GKQ8_9ALVE|eukprot:Cvel_22340.t1-p1 / transcript=Cvel_22340.t1 / gene=Cvel_22340 / organism=Chromera_velia_CCMP2878 / gene_product=hypothetical protein / transcript_product=hypothetical protein / location=Cvel_scaffold2186:22875-24446(-) / protein_length=98 / sequence_SO=supercontig / SO=protein_coding / is_pseudo=false
MVASFGSTPYCWNDQSNSLSSDADPLCDTPVLSCFLSPPLRRKLRLRLDRGADGIPAGARNRVEARDREIEGLSEGAMLERRWDLIPNMREVHAMRSG